MYIHKTAVRTLLSVMAVTGGLALASSVLVASAAPGDPIPGIPIGLDHCPGEFCFESVGILPTSHFYFLKSWGRNIAWFFTFDATAKAKLDLTIATEKAAEALAVVKADPKDAAGAADALRNFAEAQDNLNGQLAQLPSASPDAAGLLKAADEQSAKHAAAVQQVLRDTIWGDTDINRAKTAAEDSLQKTFTATVSPGAAVPTGTVSFLKQKAADQITAAEQAAKKAEASVFGQTVTFTATVMAGGTPGAPSEIVIGFAPLKPAEFKTATPPKGDIGLPSTNKPIPGVDIIVKKHPGGIAVTTTTGTDGSFGFTGLEPGAYDLSVAGLAVKPIAVGADGDLRGTVATSNDSEWKYVPVRRFMAANAGGTEPNDGSLWLFGSVLNANGHLETAKEALAAGDDGKAYGLARSADILVTNTFGSEAGRSQSSPSVTPSTKIPENNSPLPTDRSTVKTPTTEKSAPEKTVTPTPAVEPKTPDVAPAPAEPAAPAPAPTDAKTPTDATSPTDAGSAGGSAGGAGSPL